MKSEKRAIWKQRLVAACQNSRIGIYLSADLRHTGFHALFVTAALLIAVTSSAQEGEPHQLPRAVTVMDAIQMTRLGNAPYFSGSSEFSVGSFSPDGKRFIVVLTRGAVDRNTNQYSLLLFETSSVFHSFKPQVLLTMSSSSNREGITNLKWLADNETIAFIGEDPGESPQVYTLNIRTKLLKRQTEHPTPIRAFDASDDGNQVIFEADPPSARMDMDEVRRNGIIVTNQPLNDLLAGDSYRFRLTIQNGEELFLKMRGQPAVRVQLEDVAALTGLSLSPDGRYALIEAFVRHVPKTWEAYDDKYIHAFVRDQREGTVSHLKRYLLLDVKNLQISPLLDTPSNADTNGFAWAPDGQSVVISGARLPLEVADNAELKRREKNVYVIEISLISRSVSIISEKTLRVTQWDRNANRILLAPDDSGNDVVAAAYGKTGSEWKEVPVPLLGENKVNARLNVTLEEDSNNPPKIYATDPITKQRVLLVDLNPQFSTLRFGRVEQISWKATDGHVVDGGLYLPPDYIPGMRYPLVIQTHGFDKNRFYVDGPYSSAFAARPLAGEGFVVLQVGFSEDKDTLLKTVETPEEAPYHMTEYEGAIDYLDERGLIDRNRVGIIGFSRTVYYVEYALTHSKYRLAAATVADGMNAGYFTYVISPLGQFERLNGGPPFGDTLAVWLKNSPGFNLDKVHAPVRIESYGLSGTLLLVWEWFSGLSRLRKAVDLVYLPDAPHELVKPWERLVSLQGNVDWFRFWLKGEEDSDPTKAEQYTRWRELRKLYGRN